jgi:hypothetical protein
VEEVEVVRHIARSVYPPTHRKVRDGWGTRRSEPIIWVFTCIGVYV